MAPVPTNSNLIPPRWLTTITPDTYYQLHSGDNSTYTISYDPVTEACIYCLTWLLFALGLIIFFAAMLEFLRSPEPNLRQEPDDIEKRFRITLKRQVRRDRIQQWWNFLSLNEE